MTRTTARPSVPRRKAEDVLIDAQKRGDAEVVGILTWLLDGQKNRVDRRQQRREQLFGAERAAYLEQLDRRRDAARRLPPICVDEPHRHQQGCRDPLADAS